MATTGATVTPPLLTVEVHPSAVSPPQPTTVTPPPLTVEVHPSAVSPPQPTIITPPLLTAEVHPSALSPPQPTTVTTTAAVTPTLPAAVAYPSAVSPPPPTLEPQDLSNITNHPSSSPQFQELEALSPAVTSPRLFTNSITELKDLSVAITAFHQCYEDLQHHLDSIRAAILSKLPKLLAEASNVAPLPTVPQGGQNTHVPEELALQKQLQDQEILLQKEPPHQGIVVSQNRQSDQEIVLQKEPPHQEIVVSQNQQPDQEIVPQNLQADQNSRNSELESLCKIMCSRGLKKYIANHLSDPHRLREEVPKALRAAPNPAKLVLGSLGKFFLQGSKAYTRNSPMIQVREASILMLECFLLMMGMDTTNEKYSRVSNIEKALREEAETSALAWRKRLIAEGGIAKANQVDARGLLLFVACFGIPASFKREDFRDLVIAGNAKEIVCVLQKSRSLMNKIPEIVVWMMKHKMEVDAVDIAYTFGLEQRFDLQATLISLLQESKESWNKPKKGSQGSTPSLNAVNKKQLSSLKSINKCLDKHKIDPSKLLPGWQINEKIATLEKIVTLEKDISNFDRKSGDRTAHKRNSSETETSKKSKNREAKRSRHSGHGPQKFLSDNGLHSRANNYSASSSVVYGGPGAGLLPETMIAPGVGAGSSGTHGSIVSAGAHPGVHSHLYAWNRDAALNERYVQSSAVGLTSLYRASTVEGFPGVPTASVGGAGIRGSGSDLYQFADAVIEREPFPPSVARTVGALPSAVPAHYSSYLYRV